MFYSRISYSCIDPTLAPYAERATSPKHQAERGIISKGLLTQPDGLYDHAAYQAPKQQPKKEGHVHTVCPLHVGIDVRRLGQAEQRLFNRRTTKLVSEPYIFSYVAMREPMNVVTSRLRTWQISSGTSQIVAPIFLAILILSLAFKYASSPVRPLVTKS